MDLSFRGHECVPRLTMDEMKPSKLLPICLIVHIPFSFSRFDTFFLFLFFL